MRFFHLSDLHIGKTLNGFSMLEEQRNAFRQIISYIKEKLPNVVIIAGDIYDRTIPGVEAVRVFDDFLTELCQTGVVLLLISGNHDSPERLNYASRLLLDKQLYIYSAFNGKPKNVTLVDEFGDVNFWLLPFIKPSSVRGMFGEQEAESYTDTVKLALESATIDYLQRNVLVSHQFYTKPGITAIRSESELNPVGGLDAVDTGVIDKFDYVAAGHLHGTQSVGMNNIRYAGSPIKYSFSEWKHKKSVTFVELKEKGNFEILKLPLVPIHDMREIKGKLNKLISDEVNSLLNKEDYLRVILTDEEEIIDPIGKLKTIYKNIMSLDFENSRTNVNVGSITSNAEKIEALSPYELFSEFFLKIQGSTMSEDQAAIVMELLETEDVQ